VKVVWRPELGREDRAFEREFEGIQRFEAVSRSHPSQLAILHVGKNDEAGYFYYVMELADPFESSKPEIRNPKEVRNPKSEIHATNGDVRPSAFGLLSAFDLRTSDLYVPHTLREDLKRRGPLPATECLEIGAALATALAHLHEHGLVHRDVKPSNVIFVNGIPKLADIGLVAGTDDTMSFVGTEGYIPPEGPGTPSADCYALGKLLYELSTGYHRNAWPEPPADLAKRADRKLLLELNAILHKACAPVPHDRYPKAGAMLAELESLKGGKSVKRKRVIGQWWTLTKNIALVVSAIAAVSAIAIFAARQRSQAPSLPASSELSRNQEARRLYKRAEFLINHGTREQNQTAFTNLWKAVDLDTNFLAAYYKLFECYFGSLGKDLPPHEDMMKNMGWVLDQIRRVDPKSVEYHTVHSLILFYERRFDEAISEVERGLVLNTNFVRAHALHGWYLLLSRGDAATAYREYAAAERLDPSDLIIQAHRALPYYFERKFEQAIELTKDAMRFFPNTEQAHELLGRYYEAAGFLTNAIDEYETAAKFAARNEDVKKVEAEYVVQRANLREKGAEGWRRAKLDKALKAGSQDYLELAKLCAQLRDRDGALYYLNQAVEAHDPNLVHLLCEDWWDPLRSDREFQDLVKRVGLKPMGDQSHHK
jgi:serine/threonine protein kinase